MPFKNITSHHQKSRKKRYRVRNWSEYNRALIDRGGILFILMEDITEKWSASPEKRCPEGKKLYSDFAIEFCLQVRRSWRKLYIAIDESGNILASSLTENNIDDGTEVPDLMDQVDGTVTVFMGDGAYDTAPVHGLLEDRYPGIRLVTPPRKDAVFSSSAATAPTQRDDHIKTIHEEGRAHWFRSHSTKP